MEKKYSEESKKVKGMNTMDLTMIQLIWQRECYDVILVF